MVKNTVMDIIRLNHKAKNVFQSQISAFTVINVKRFQSKIAELNELCDSFNILELSNKDVFDVEME